MTDRYLTKKILGICTYPGCSAPAQDEHCQCARHAEGHARRNKKAMRRTRAWRRVQLGLEL